MIVFFFFIKKLAELDLDKKLSVRTNPNMPSSQKRDSIERVVTATLDENGKVVITSEYLNNDNKFVEK